MGWSLQPDGTGVTRQARIDVNKGWISELQIEMNSFFESSGQATEFTIESSSWTQRYFLNLRPRKITLHLDISKASDGTYLDQRMHWQSRAGFILTSSTYSGVELVIRKTSNSTDALRKIRGNAMTTNRRIQRRNRGFEMTGCWFGWA
jgi:hypothetical protein